MRRLSPLQRAYRLSFLRAMRKARKELAPLKLQRRWKPGRATRGLICLPGPARRMRFGRFLTFITTVINAESMPLSFTERAFRDLWEQTDKTELNERIRGRDDPGGGGGGGSRRARRTSGYRTFQGQGAGGKFRESLWRGARRQQK